MLNIKPQLKYLIPFSLLIWMFITSIMVIEKGINDSPSQSVWIQNIIFSLGWILWAFVTPIVYSIYRRYSIVSKEKLAFLLIHLGFSLVTSLVYFMFSGFVVWALWNLFVSSQNYFNILLFLLESFHINLLIYWILIAAFTLLDWIGLSELRTEHAQDKFIKRLAVKDSLKILNIQVDDICYFEAYGDYVKVYVGTKFYLINSSMTELEKQLDPSCFTRVHRSAIVNINFIVELEPYTNKEFHLTMKNGKVLKASRTYHENLRKHFANTI